MGEQRKRGLSPGGGGGGGGGVSGGVGGGADLKFVATVTTGGRVNFAPAV